MALPLSAQVTLAQAICENIDQGRSDPSENELARELQWREEELSSGAVTGYTHAEVMQAARRV